MNIDPSISNRAFLAFLHVVCKKRNGVGHVRCTHLHTSDACSVFLLCQCTTCLQNKYSIATDFNIVHIWAAMQHLSSVLRETGVKTVFYLLFFTLVKIS